MELPTKNYLLSFLTIMTSGALRLLIWTGLLCQTTAYGTCSLAQTSSLAFENGANGSQISAVAAKTVLRGTLKRSVASGGPHNSRHPTIFKLIKVAIFKAHFANSTKSQTSPVTNIQKNQGHKSKTQHLIAEGPTCSITGRNEDLALQ